MNKIQPINLAHTPKDWTELTQWLEGFNGSERGVATLAALMAWNLAAKLTQETEDA